jgi:hypothetical protein
MAIAVTLMNHIEYAVFVVVFFLTEVLNGNGVQCHQCLPLTTRAKLLIMLESYIELAK